jgi:hypothetical protein
VITMMAQQPFHTPMAGENCTAGWTCARHLRSGMGYSLTALPKLRLRATPMLPGCKTAPRGRSRRSPRPEFDLPAGSRQHVHASLQRRPDTMHIVVVV